MPQVLAPMCATEGTRRRHVECTPHSLQKWQTVSLSDRDQPSAVVRIYVLRLRTSGRLFSFQHFR
jgi:hypothetical protein